MPKTVLFRTILLIFVFIFIYKILEIPYFSKFIHKMKERKKHEKFRFFQVNKLVYINMLV